MCRIIFLSEMELFLVQEMCLFQRYMNKKLGDFRIMTHDQCCHKYLKVNVVYDRLRDSYIPALINFNLVPDHTYGIVLYPFLQTNEPHTFQRQKTQGQLLS